MSISEAHKNIREILHRGTETREWLVSYGHERLLAAYDIEAVGWVEAHEGYRIIRPRPNLALIYVCLEGRGEVMEDGEWVCCEAGQAYLAPIGKLHGYRVVPGVEWKSCWVVGRDASFVGVETARRVNAAGHALWHAVQGLHSEDNNAAEAALMEAWIRLISGYARRIGNPAEANEGRLTPLWARAAADLAFPWTVAALAQAASLSEETLRRVSLKETGHPPMEYVTHLRMRTAASLLRSQPYTVAEVAPRVGYSNPFTFSVAFKRIIGVPPSRCRQESQQI